MSGGSFDYIQHKIDDAARQIIAGSTNRTDGVLLRAFGKHLLEIGRICHEIEWDFSGDSSLKPKDHKAIQAAIGAGAVLAEGLEEAMAAHEKLGKIIDGIVA